MGKFPIQIQSQQMIKLTLLMDFPCWIGHVKLYMLGM